MLPSELFSIIDILNYNILQSFFFFFFLGWGGGGGALKMIVIVVFGALFYPLAVNIFVKFLEI